MEHTKTLLLTPWYFPIQVLRWEDAVKMRYEGTIDVVAEYDETISSPSITWKMPAVVRLKKLKTQPRQRNGVKFSRQNVYMRDSYCCQYCGNRFDLSKLSYDHVTPKSAGGRRCWTNIVTACRPCNLRKADRTCDESGMWPRKMPAHPSSLPLARPMIDLSAAPDEWHEFLGAWSI